MANLPRLPPAQWHVPARTCATSKSVGEGLFPTASGGHQSTENDFARQTCFLKFPSGDLRRPAPRSPACNNFKPSPPGCLEEEQIAPLKIKTTVRSLSHEERHFESRRGRRVGFRCGF